MCRSSSQLSLWNSNREKKEAPTGERWMKWMMGFRGFVSCPDNSVLQMCTHWSAWFKQWSHFCIFSFHFAFPGRYLSVGSAYSHRGLSIRYSLTARLIYSWASSKRMESTLAVFIFFYLLTPPAATKFTKDMLLPSLMKKCLVPTLSDLPKESDSAGKNRLFLHWLPGHQFFLISLLCSASPLSGIQTLGAALFIPHPTL